MNLLILGGFLGSGKTTVLLQLAKYITGDHVKPGETKVAIIENEIGEQGIDDKILKSGNYSVENLFAGCACWRRNPPRRPPWPWEGRPKPSTRSCPGAKRC